LQGAGSQFGLHVRSKLKEIYGGESVKKDAYPKKAFMAPRDGWRRVIRFKSRSTARFFSSPL
jgi:hypothetical protein